ncbi:mitochondrial pyruvate carrier protein 2 [Lotmaria passim]
MSAAVAAQSIPKAFPKVFHSWVGTGRIFNFLKPYETNPVIAYFNSIYNTAPLFKWSLSIVPLYGIVSGNPPVEKIDFNSSVALCATGCIWFVYALLIQPQNSGSRSLALVNICLATVNGYNCYRSAVYQRSLASSPKKIE